MSVWDVRPAEPSVRAITDHDTWVTRREHYARYGSDWHMKHLLDIVTLEVPREALPPEKPRPWYRDESLRSAVMIVLMASGLAGIVLYSLIMMIMTT